MIYKFVIILCLHLTSIHSAPMKLQLLPLPYGMQPQNPLAQLQNPVFRMGANNILPPFMFPQQRIMVLIPNPAADAEADDRNISDNENESTNKLKSNTGYIDEVKDAVILDADPVSAELDYKKALIRKKNDPKYLIGEIISYIPFLPIEINVPDAINWIWGLFPGWFQRPTAQKLETMKRLSNKGPIPIFVLPDPMMT